MSVEEEHEEISIPIDLAVAKDACQPSSIANPDFSRLSSQNSRPKDPTKIRLTSLSTFGMMIAIHIRQPIAGARTHENLYSFN
jgi:hypothetical protein